MKPENKPQNSRRNFLVGATLGSAGAVAAVVTGSAEEVLAVAGVESKPAKPKGYHVTDHVQQYYDTTRI